MKKFAIIILMIMTGIMYAKSSELPDISDNTEFYMITCEPGEEAYTLFGHSAIRVIDKTQNLDVAFNWGVFSFEAPNFIGRFVVGKTDYELAVWRTELFLAEYRERGSAVHQCHINLDSIEKQRLWTMLCTNYEPENRVYRYNFIYDNCATRVVDMILASYDSIYAPSFELPSKSYRDFVNSYTHPDNFLALGINLVFGKSADYVIPKRKTTTFPLQAMALLSETSVMRDGQQEPILTDHAYICNSNKTGSWKEYSKGKETLMCLLPLAIMALMIFLFLYHKRYHYKKFLAEIILWILFLLSLLILFLELFTTHPLVEYNLNILWCSPLAGVLAVVLLLRHKKNFKFVVALATFLSTFSFLFVLTNSAQAVSWPLFFWWLMAFACELLIVLSYLHHFARSIKVYNNSSKKHHHHHHHHHHGSTPPSHYHEYHHHHHSHHHSHHHEEE